MSSVFITHSPNETSKEILQVISRISEIHRDKLSEHFFIGEDFSANNVTGLKETWIVLTNKSSVTIIECTLLKLTWDKLTF